MSTNYRRGLKRTFAVLAFAWVVFVFSTVFSGNWRPWDRIQVSEWQTTDEQAAPNGLSAAERNSIEAQISHDLLVRKWSWATGLSLLPPAALYFLLFYVSLWIYRGFRPAAQI